MDRTTISGQSEGSIASDVTTVSQLTTQIKNKGALSSDENKKLIEIVKLLKENNEYMNLQKADRKLIEKQLKENNKENTKNWLKSFADGEKNAQRLQKALTSAFQKIDSHIQTYTQYAIRVNAALEGTQKTYATAVQNLTNAIGTTGLAKMSDVLAQMNSLTEQGLVANVEQNAFLMSIKDGIESTFNAANGTLVRLIKLQGEDSTVNRLVMQASLKEYLNATYQNSQYMHGLFDTVSTNLINATSLLTSALSNSLEATVQKWLGSLSSMGLSDKAVGSLSSALGAVGSGNLRGIDESMQNLVIMGANRAGLSYSDLLTGGLSSADTNQLMYGMIDYLGSLQGNNVVLSEYANIFGMDVSDLVAARNARGKLGAISGANIGYETSGLGQYLSNYNRYLNSSPGALYDNLFDNMLFGMGANVASNRGSYMTYKTGSLIGSITSQLGLSGVAGNIINLIGPGIQLAAALGGGEGGFSITNIGNTLKNLGTSLGNIFYDPDAILAYNMLTGAGISAGAGNIADVINQAGSSGIGGIGGNGMSRGSSASSGSAFGEGGTVDVAISESMSAIEEAQAARTVDDIYEFLSDDVVTITPYPETTQETINIITDYNKKTAENTGAILNFMITKLGPYLLFESINEGNSLMAAVGNYAEGSEEWETARGAADSYAQWVSGFGG